MAVEICHFCHDPFTVGLEQEKRSDNEAPLRACIKISDLQTDCRYCSFLRQMILHFVPCIEQQYASPYVWVSLEEGCAARIDVSDWDDKHGRNYRRLSQFYVYLQKEVGYLAQVLPKG